MKDFRSAPIKLSENIFLTAENGVSDDIQVLRVGTFFHEGQIVDVTKAHLKSMIKNFSEEVRGIDLMLDYSHESEKEAAAWFEDLYLSDDGKELWAKVDWTEDGADSVRKKKYRYISADFNFAYKDNETLKDHGPTLLGAGLTNRPVIKKMNPTILSENNYNLKKDNEMAMTPEETKKMEDLEKSNKELASKLAEKDDNAKDKEFAEKEADLKKREDAIKLSEEKAEQDKKDAEKKTEFDTMLSEGKAVEAQREAFIKGDMTEFIKNAVKAGSVNLSEKGNNGNGNNIDTDVFEGDTPAQDEVISLAEKKVKENDQVDINEAISFVLSENSELAKKYKEETE